MLFWLAFAAAQAWAFSRQTLRALPRWLGVYAAGLIAASLAAGSTFFALVYYSGLDVLQNRWHSLIVLALSATVFGAAMTLTQWTVLRRRIEAAPYWAIAVTVVAMVSWTASFYWAQALPYLFSIPQTLTLGLMLPAGAAWGGVSGGLMATARNRRGSGSRRQLVRCFVWVGAIALGIGLTAIPAYEIQDTDVQRVTLSEAEAIAEFPLLVPTALPEGYEFKEARITQHPDRHQNIALFYQSGSSQIVVNQSPIPEGVGAAANLGPSLGPHAETLRLRGQIARLENVTTMPALLWQERGVQLSIHNHLFLNSQPPSEPASAVSETALVELAESMRWTR
ncbi:MAG: hypothetical protein ACFB5Z_12685 [Elainellaceae cyanobacterium]